ncbi:MAG: hypothetical protein A2189_00125, partial [Paenibacillus sp. RIFOXYA1_FULL_44_5]
MEKTKPVASSHQHKIIPIQLDATFFFERAVQSMNRYHYDKALKYFRKAVEYEPENPVNQCNLAGILSEMGKYDESNAILQDVITRIDPSMTECYFYMANNYANMEDFETAEQALVQYLEKDTEGQFLTESEEMMDFLSFELERPTQITSIKSREGLIEHDKARELLEEGKFVEAVQLLEKIVKKFPQFAAAQNNLSLAYYYLGYFEKALSTIYKVLDIEAGNLHALCNLAIFYQHFGYESKLQGLLQQLKKTYPMQEDHLFKVATTMGILGEHSTAFRLFKRILRTGDSGMDPALYHYAAAAAFNSGYAHEAEKLWQRAQNLDPKSDIARFYLSQMKSLQTSDKKSTISYQYHLPFEEQFRQLENSEEGFSQLIIQDPMVRSSFFWALRHGDRDTKLQVIQAFGIIADSEIENMLR